MKASKDISIEECAQILEEHGIKPTANRTMIVKLLHNAPNPMSMSDLESELMTVDKSVISRSLALFGNAHLVHRIDGGGDGTLFELCRCTWEDGEDSDTHVHFHCDSCHRTLCLDSIPIPHTELPEGYKVRFANYIACGLCPECAAKEARRSF